MPVVQAYESRRILVTGANGFIALWVTRTLLEQGYRVRGTVRSDEKGNQFLQAFKEYGDRVEFVIVDDFTKEDAFDEAVKGVDAIEHLAAPSSLTCDDPDDLIIPSVIGTLSILTSALKYGKNIKRIVVTSACAALMRNVKVPGEVYDENDWADEAITAVNELGRGAPSLAKIRAAKALAERGAWEFCEKHKHDITWDLVAILPPVTIGPPLQEVSTPADLNLSLALFYKLLFTSQPDETLKATYNYVHVQDVAAAHVESLKKETAGGERIIIWGGAINIQNNRNIMHKLYPELYASGMLPRGNPEINEPIIWTYNPEKGKKILGMEYRTIDDISKDMVDYMTSKGWFKKGQFTSS